MRISSDNRSDDDKSSNVVESEEFTFIVALGYKDETNRTTYWCAGVLISDTWVLSAAHCIKKRLIYVKIGSVSILNKIWYLKYCYFLQID